MAVNTIFKWPGGKRSVLKQLIPYFPSHINHYIEPFIGGGTVFLHLLPGSAFLSDANPELINTYVQIKDDPIKLIEELRNYDNNTREFYLEIRSWIPKTDLERAVRFIYLNKTCFNGLWRVNKKGEFNVPFGNRKNPNIVDSNGIMDMSGALKNAIIQNCDYTKLVNHLHPNTFVYFDPPYYKLTDGNFTSYTKDTFTKEDQIKLRDICDILDQQGHKFMYNNSAHPFIVQLFQKYNIRPIVGRTSISGYKDKRPTTDEVLITNY